MIAPCDGTVSATMGHAVCLECDNGLELLIHVGIDTVKLGGKHYTSLVEEGQHVRAGEKLMEFDIPAIEAEGFRTITPVIITNSDDYSDVTGISGIVPAGQPMMAVQK